MGSRGWSRRAGVVAAVMAGLAPLIPAAPAQASTERVWTGACASPGCDSRAWGEPDNWSPNGVPQSDDSVVVAVPHEVAGLPATLTLKSLTLTNAASLRANPGTASITVTDLHLDCMAVSGVTVTATTTVATSGFLRGGSVIVPPGGEMTVRYPTGDDDGCLTHPDPGYRSTVGTLRLEGDARVVVSGSLRGQGARITASGADASVVITSTGVVGEGDGQLVLERVTTVLGGAVQGTGVVVAGQGRTVTLRGRVAGDPPGSAHFRMLDAARLSIRSTVTGERAAVRAVGTGEVGKGAVLLLGRGVDLRGSSSLVGQGTLTLPESADPSPIVTTITGTHVVATRLVMAGRAVLTASSRLTASGPTSLGGRLRVHSDAVLSLAGPTRLTAAVLDSSTCCSRRGAVRVLAGARVRLGSQAAPTVRFLRVTVGGRLDLGGGSLVLDRAPLVVQRAGELVGPGRVAGNPVVSGAVSLAARGALRIGGALRLTRSATTRLVVGATAADSDRVVASGPVTLGGRLTLSSGTTAVREFAVVAGSSRTSTFDDATGMPGGRRLDYRERSASLTLTDLLPDLRMLPAERLAISWERGLRLLRFSSIVANVGAGPFVAVGSRACTSMVTCPEMTVHQQFLQPGGSWREVATQARMKMEVGDGHAHWHVIGMERFELFDLAAPGGGRPLLGRKFGYCFYDSRAHRLELPGAPDGQRFWSSGCGTTGSRTNRMGLSVGWGDVYPYYLYGQWIDITGVADGDYLLCLTADPKDEFTEVSDTNNQVWQRLRIGDQSAVVRDWGYGDCSAQVRPD